ncbi:cation:proton antiporter [Lacticaseibacillus jixianensis]|uniref:Cation:proton antiporter n=1 Tax=Lacticaseibacillus jixianensis TaxID=2486012 RepID=A0ABW4B773_9LACO|nr:sodium:proton antiporter [Lacticaseibacillus jixianensis]
MQLVEAVLLLIALVIVSNVISHYLVAVPVSLIQAALGLAAALFFSLSLDMETDWFMLLFTAPLLYNDGRRFPKRELWELRGAIAGNAILLVFIITFLGGFFLHWLVPAMPLAASFALAAILAPTDPIAVQSLASRVHLPAGLMHLIAGESLINDASGLIGFKYGIAAVMTGTFVWTQAIGDFVYIAGVGALAGALLMGLINLLRLWLLQQGINDTILHAVLQLITPFLIYLLVDEVIGASGVIAVVVAGLLTNASGNRFISALPELRIVTEKTWDIVVYVLNGLIFILLGLELPVAMRATIQSRAVSTWQALMDVVLVYLVMLAIRVGWTYGYMRLTAWQKAEADRPSLHLALLNGIAGVRGAISLVAVLAIPVLLPSGAHFPERALMLFIAAGYIVLSMIVATVLLPIMTQNRTPLKLRGSAIEDDDDGDDEPQAAPGGVRLLDQAQAQRYLYQMAVRKLEGERREDNQKPVLDLIDEYQHLLRRLDLQADDSGELPPFVQDEIDLRAVGVAGELARLEELHAANQVSDRVYQKTKRRLHTRENSLVAMAQNHGRLTWSDVLARAKAALPHWWHKVAAERLGQTGEPERLFVEKEIAKGGLKTLSEYLRQPEHRKRQFNRQVIYALIVQYRGRIATAKANANRAHKSVQYEQEMARLRTLALAAERTAIHDLLEQGHITTGTAQRLSQIVNYTENAATLAALEEA